VLTPDVLVSPLGSGASAGPSASATAAPAGNAPSPPAETVVRPEPGLARGLWEAPAWLFFALALAAVVAAAAWMGAGYRARARKGSK
jgi:hypothetical protein